MAKKVAVKEAKKAGRKNFNKRTKRELWMEKLNTMHAFLLEVEKPCYGLDADLSDLKEGLINLARSINDMPADWQPRKRTMKKLTPEQLERKRKMLATLQAQIAATEAEE